MTSLHIRSERWPLKTPLRDGGGLLTDLEVIVVTLVDGTCSGRGEAAGVHYHGETPQSMSEQIERVRRRIEGGATREQLLDLLPAGGARNAVDCALWELEARRAGCAVWQLAGLSPPRSIRTTYTIGAAAPGEMAAQAVVFADARAIKLKLLGDEFDIERVRAVRQARSDVWLCVDANQSFTRASYDAILPTLAEARVSLIEQPFPADADTQLDALDASILIAADESAQDLQDLARLAGRYDFVNIKLDKCGGLTQALAMAHEARRLGLEIMVGCMAGTTLAMAPAFVLGQLAHIVDLDGPPLLRDDRPDPAHYESGNIWCPESCWGGIARPAAPP